MKASVLVRPCIVVGLLSASAGCAMFRPVQLHPDEWNDVDAPVSRRHALTEEERRRLSQPPPDLEEAIIWTNREYQRFWVKEHAVLSVPHHIGNLLIGLASFGIYRGVTHPSAETTAGVAALGTAAYAGGAAVDWKAQALVFQQVREELLCLTGEAGKYRIKPVRAWRALPATTGRQQLLEAGTATREKVANLDDLLARHAALNQHYLESRARVLKGPCPDAAWGAGSCTPPAGPDGAAFEKICRQLQARHAAMCAARNHPAVYSVPAPEVAAVFAAAERVRAGTDDNLLESARMQSASDRAGFTLWRMTNAAINKASAALVPTGTDLAKVMAALKAPQQPKPADQVTGKAQLGRFTDIPPNARTQARPLDARSLHALAAIEAAILQLDAAARTLREALAINADMPPRLDESKFEACISPEVKLVQAIGSTESPATASARQDASEKALREASDEDLAALGLSRGASPAEIETRLRTCQRTKGITEDGKLTGAMQQHLREGLCRDISWK